MKIPYRTSAASRVRRTLREVFVIAKRQVASNAVMAIKVGILNDLDKGFGNIENFFICFMKCGVYCYANNRNEIFIVIAESHNT